MSNNSWASVSIQLIGSLTCNAPVLLAAYPHLLLLTNPLLSIFVLTARRTGVFSDRNPYHKLSLNGAIITAPSVTVCRSSYYYY